MLMTIKPNPPPEEDPMSTTKRTLGAEAADPKTGMTVSEILAWAQEAVEQGLGEAYPTAIVKIGSARVKKIEVKG